MIITTGHNIEGYEITEYLDIVAAEFAYQTTYFKGFISKEIYNVANAAGVLDKTQKGFITADSKIFVLKGLREQAKKLGANGIISVSLQFSSVTDDFVIIIGTGTAVKIRKKHDENEIDYKKLSALIDAAYLDRVVKDNAKAAKEIQEKRLAISLYQETLNNKEREWNEKKSDVKKRTDEIDDKIFELKDQIAELKSIIIKLKSYGRDNLTDKIIEKNKELKILLDTCRQLERQKSSIQAELTPYEEEYAQAYDKQQSLINDLRQYEDFLL